MTVAELEERIGFGEVREWVEFLSRPPARDPNNLLDMAPDAMIGQFMKG